MKEITITQKDLKTTSGIFPISWGTEVTLKGNLCRLSRDAWRALGNIPDPVRIESLQQIKNLEAVPGYFPRFRLTANSNTLAGLKAPQVWLSFARALTLTDCNLWGASCPDVLHIESSNIENVRGEHDVRIRNSKVGVVHGAYVTLSSSTANAATAGDGEVVLRDSSLSQFSSNIIVVGSEPSNVGKVQVIPQGTLRIGPCGEFNRVVRCLVHPKGEMYCCGCLHGPYNKLVEAIERKYGNGTQRRYKPMYLAAVASLRAMAKLARAQWRAGRVKP